MEAMEAMTVNWLGVLLAALSAFLVGGLWYGPLFGKAWMEAFNISEDDIAKGHGPKVFGLAFLLSLIAAFNLAMFLGPEADIGFGAAAGFAAGFGWVAMFIGIIYLFESRPFKAWAVNAGYCTVALTLMGLILGAF
jgi:hypothetical protein